jgi:mRNA interferase MazF
MVRGEVHWVDFGVPRGSAPAYRRPAVIISADPFNRSDISTVIVTAVTTVKQSAHRPGVVALKSGDAGLSEDSWINLSQVRTVDKIDLDGLIGRLSSEHEAALDVELARVIGLK